MALQAPAPTKHGSQKVTNGYRVTVRPRYLSHESNPDSRQYVFAYHIRIANESGQTAKLQERRWLILDAAGRGEEVRGEGVVGAQPHLAPGEVFEYESYCPLRTPWGTMEGAYSMKADSGELFEIEVGRFYLVSE